MPYRSNPIITGQIYHIYNRSIARQPIFLRKTEYQRAYDLIDYYRFEHPRLRFSHYKRLNKLEKQVYIKQLYKTNINIRILAYCLMPNHFHFLVEQIVEKGIKMFISNFQNSYAKYTNMKTKRTGSLFQAMFKSVRIETDGQLLHLNRYININPLTSFIIKDVSELTDYPWTSYLDYIGKRNPTFVSTEKVLANFKTTKSFIDFTLDQVEYQRKLNEIKYLTFE